MDCQFQQKYQRLQFKLETQNYYLVRSKDNFPKIEFGRRQVLRFISATTYNLPFIPFRPNSVEVDSGVYSATENHNNVNIYWHLNREKKLDPTLLIDKMIQRLDNLDLNISIALGKIMSEKIRHECQDSDIESCESKSKIKDTGLSAETIFKKLNEVERKVSNALK